MWRDTKTQVLVDGKWVPEADYEAKLARENPNVKRNLEAVEHCRESIAYKMMRQKQLIILFDTNSYQKFVDRFMNPSSRPFLFDPSVERTTGVQLVSFFHLGPKDLFRWSVPNRFKTRDQLEQEWNIEDWYHDRLRDDFDMMARKLREEQAIQIEKGWIRIATDND